MKKAFYNFYNFIGKIYLAPIFKFEQKKRPFSIINERPAEYAFAFKNIQELGTGKILDIGSGVSSWPHLLSNCGFEVKAIDKIDGYWNGFYNRHFKIIHDDITDSKLNETFQFATCLSVLEHIPDHRMAMINIHKLLEKNGYLVLTFPYSENYYSDNIYAHPKSNAGKVTNFVTQVYSRNEINGWLADTSFKIIDQEYYKAFTGEFWSMGERVVPIAKVEKEDLHQLTCILLQKTAN